MILKQEPRRRRAGFTLIELLIVIAILGVLFALAAVGLTKFIGKGAEVTTRKDISELSTAIGLFKTKMQVDWVPSRIVLIENGIYTPPSAAQAQLYADSAVYLQKVFPGINLTTGHDWNGDGAVDPPLNGAGTPSVAYELEGHQCLVFFLGGIPASNPNGCLGFSANRRNPTQAGGERIGPFLEFQPGRLVATNGRFLSYIDGYGKQPYLYFSAYKSRNGYNRYGVDDNPAMSQGAYFLQAGRYHNPSSFQIISAGDDGAFGQGGALATFGEAVAPPAADDMTNFYESLLGSGS